MGQMERERGCLGSRSPLCVCTGVSSGWEARGTVLVGSVSVVLAVARAAVCILLLLQGCSCLCAGHSGTQVSLGIPMSVLCGQRMLLLTPLPLSGVGTPLPPPWES